MIFMTRKFKRTAFIEIIIEIKIFCNINIFTVTFDQFNAHL